MGEAVLARGWVPEQIDVSNRRLSIVLPCHRMTRREPPIHCDSLSIDIACFIRSQKQRGLGELLGLRCTAKRIQAPDPVHLSRITRIVEGRLGHPRFGQAGANSVYAHI